MKGGQLEPYSAGVTAKGLDPRAVRVMAEVGLDISAQRSKVIDDLPVRDFAYVITVCDKAKESCPVFPGKTRLIHHGFDDPPDLAAETANEEEAMGHYRRVRDEIRAFVESLPQILEEEESSVKKHILEALGEIG